MPRKIFALSDLHLSFAKPKPMDVFGPGWSDHSSRVELSWRAAVGADDLVLVPGDVSWAMKLEEAAADLAWIAALPGEKVFVKGNHDYWWSTIGKVRRAAGAGMHFIQNDVCLLDGVACAGARLWDFPEVRWAPPPAGGSALPGAEGKHARGETEPDPEKIRARELERLECSLSLLPREATLRVALTHFPPISGDGSATPLTRLMDKYEVDLCVYGHVHHAHLLSPEARAGTDCVLGKTRYVLAACDWLGCAPKLLAEA